MKATLYDLSGKKKGEVEMPKQFDSIVREDIALKYFEANKRVQPYSSYSEAGKRHSASGIISHKRHDWKGQYGKGISRTPRKIIWRRGVQFNWIGAEVANTRGGRRAHPPKGIRAKKKINQKEMKIAMNSAFSATLHEDYVMKRYASLEKLPVKLPVVVESKLENIKTKQFLLLLKTILGDTRLALRNKVVRAGKGKLRGRKYKSNAGLLLVTGSEEKVKLSGIVVKPWDKVSIADLYPLGRLTFYTEKAVEEMSK